MTPRDFAYWLRGYIELTGAKKLNKKQVKEINRHLDIVFNQEFDDKNDSLVWDNTSLVENWPHGVCASC